MESVRALKYKEKDINAPSKNEHEGEEEKEGVVDEMINFNKFFTYITFKDKLLIIFGTLGALIAGVLLPCISLAFGSITNSFDPSNGPDAMLDSMKKITLYICLVGIASWVFGYVYYAFWQHLA